jgi:hypothetical protein
MYLFKFSYIELIFHSVPTSTKKSLALVSTELKARNKSGTVRDWILIYARLEYIFSRWNILADLKKKTRIRNMHIPQRSRFIFKQHRRKSKWAESSTSLVIIGQVPDPYLADGCVDKLFFSIHIVNISVNSEWLNTGPSKN